MHGGKEHVYELLQDVVKDIIGFADIKAAEDSDAATPRMASPSLDEGIWTYLSPTKSLHASTPDVNASPLR